MRRRERSGALEDCIGPVGSWAEGVASMAETHRIASGAESLTRTEPLEAAGHHEVSSRLLAGTHEEPVAPVRRPHSFTE